MRETDIVIKCVFKLEDYKELCLLNKQFIAS